MTWLIDLIGDFLIGAGIIVFVVCAGTLLVEWLRPRTKRGEDPKAFFQQKLCVTIIDERRVSNNTITIIGNPRDGYMVRPFDKEKDRAVERLIFTYAKGS